MIDLLSSLFSKEFAKLPFRWLFRNHVVFKKFTHENHSFKILRLELENSNLVVTIEKQAREMEALGEKLLNTGNDVVSLIGFSLMPSIWKSCCSFSSSTPLDHVTQNEKAH